MAQSWLVFVMASAVLIGLAVLTVGIRLTPRRGRCPAAHHHKIHPQGWFWGKPSSQERIIVMENSLPATETAEPKRNSGRAGLKSPGPGDLHRL